MRAARYPTAFAVLFFLIAGVVYSAVCDASCSIYGCSTLLQENASKENDPHAHCRSGDKASRERAASHHDSAKSNIPQRRSSEDSPACVSHLYASALIPRAACAQVTWQAQALVFESPRVAPAWAAKHSDGDARGTPHRPPPDLTMLSILRV